jgi:hypothetical protein
MIAEARSWIEVLENRVLVLERRQEREQLEAAAESQLPFPLTAFLAGALAGILSASLVRRIGRTGALRRPGASATDA